MKLATYQYDSAARIGAVQGDCIIDLAAASDRRLPSDMRSFLDLGAPALQIAQDIVAGSGDGLALADVRLLPPICNPSKVIAIGLNYMDHCREQGHEPPKTPMIFTKFTTAIIGPDDTISWNPSLTQEVDYEVELAVVMGCRARNVSAADALDFVAGYTVCNDVSARDLQFSDGQWVRGKSLDTFCPLGPWIVTRDEVPDPQTLPIRCTLNGQLVQDSTTAEMIFSVATLIEFSSRAFTLLPGDVIITGTPHGVGVFREPKLFLRDGDIVTVEVEGIGRLTNRCREECV
ncbi:MAG: fumarylacetoacetate hydrolase family protein [Chloroflexi bacterium]|nr:fumarylacetoacetate hydrolase family protein [Chloroflexota bacterium]